MISSPFFHSASHPLVSPKPIAKPERAGRVSLNPITNATTDTSRTRDATPSEPRFRLPDDIDLLASVLDTTTPTAHKIDSTTPSPYRSPNPKRQDKPIPAKSQLSSYDAELRTRLGIGAPTTSLVSPRKIPKPEKARTAA